jgi:hypothetical protein
MGDDVRGAWVLIAVMHSIDISASPERVPLCSTYSAIAGQE